MGSVNITAFYAGILATMLVILSVRVVIFRWKQAVSAEGKKNDGLLPAIRGQGNFIEYVPLSLVLMGYLEFSGEPAFFIHGLGMVLVVARGLHPFGLRSEPVPNGFRAVGTLLTWSVLVMEGFVAIVGFFWGRPFF